MSGNSGVNNFFKPFLQSSGINSDRKESKEADQHAFIDDLKKKKLLLLGTNPKLK
jgi:hypothetical protein